MPLDQVDVDKQQANQEEEMSFLDHLEALRWHLIRAVVAILVIAIAVFILDDFVVDEILLAHQDKDFITYRFFSGMIDGFYPKEFSLQILKIEEMFITHLKVSILMGFVFAFPYVFWEIWRFIKPGLYENELKAARGMVFICSSLFILGVLFGYFVIAPFAVYFLSNYTPGSGENFVIDPSFSNYVNFIGMVCIPVGFVFELPVVVYFFSKIGLLTPDFMRAYRRHAIVIILLLAAMITPPDVTTQFLIGIPIYLLYEISIYVSARVVKGLEEEAK